MSTTAEVGHAVLVAVIGTFILAVITIVVGLMLDGFTYEFMNLGMKLAPEFQLLMKYPIQWANMFYCIMGLFLILFWLYPFKVAIKKTGYTYQEGVEERYNDNL